MLNKVANKSKHHLDAVSEGYFAHMFAALSYAVRLIAAGLAALVHAFIPALFEYTASRMISKMMADIQARRAGQTSH